MRIIKAFTSIILALSLLTPVTSFAQARGYEFTLNGKTYSTNSQMMSGPGGCSSDLIDRRTGRTICPLDRVVSPQSVWAGIIWRKCPIDQYGDSPCVGGIVAVGHNCPQRPEQCRYYRIVRTYDGQYGNAGGADVNLGDIHRLGNELWIEREGSSLWALFLRNQACQQTRSQYPRTC